MAYKILADRVSGRLEVMFRALLFLGFGCAVMAMVWSILEISAVAPNR